MSLLNLLIPSASADVVGIFDQNFNQVFATARPMKATYNVTAKSMEHPIEDGATITDFRIFVPTEIQISLILQATDYRSVYQQISQLFLNSTILNVQGRAKTFNNMLIDKMPSEESADMFDVIAVALTLKEAKFVTPSFGKLPATKVKNKSQASTVSAGQIEPAANNGASTLYKAFF